MRDVLKTADKLLDALETEVEQTVPGAKLISLEIEPLNEGEGEHRLETRILKSSSRVCFIQGSVFTGETPVLKARAIFRKK